MDSIKGDPSMALGGASTVAKVPFIKCVDKFLDTYKALERSLGWI